MTKSKYFIGTWRTLGFTGFFILACLSFGSVQAADGDSVSDGVKRAGNNFGDFLKGIGQGAKKAGESFGNEIKKVKKNDKKDPGKEPDKSQEKSD